MVDSGWYLKHVDVEEHPSHTMRGKAKAHRRVGHFFSYGVCWVSCLLIDSLSQIILLLAGVNPILLK